MKNLDEHVLRVERLLKQGSSLDDVLTGLRSDGLSKMQSAAVLKRLEAYSADEVVRLVHESPVWADQREADEALNADMISALEDL